MTNTTNYAAMTNEELEKSCAERKVVRVAAYKALEEANGKVEARMGKLANEIATGHDVKVDVLDDGIRFTCWDEPETKKNAYRHSHEVNVRFRTTWPNGYDNPGVQKANMDTYSRDVANGDAYGIAYYKFIGELVTRLDGILNEWNAARKDAKVEELRERFRKADVQVKVVEQVLTDREGEVKKLEIRRSLVPGAKFTSKHSRGGNYEIEKVTGKCVFVREGWNTRRYDIESFILDFVRGHNKFVAA